MVDAKAYTSTEFESSGTKMKIANSAKWRKTCVKNNLFELAAEYVPYMERRIANEACPNSFSEEYWRVKICFEFWHRDHWEQTKAIHAAHPEIALFHNRQMQLDHYFYSKWEQATHSAKLEEKQRGEPGSPNWVGANAYFWTAVHDMIEIGKMLLNLRL